MSEEQATVQATVTAPEEVVAPVAASSVGVDSAAKKDETVPAAATVSVTAADVVPNDSVTTEAQQEAPKSVDSEMAAAPTEQVVPEQPSAVDENSIVITLAGRAFKGRNELAARIKQLQAASGEGTMFGPEDAFFLYDLARYHPQFKEKMSGPIVGFKYDVHENFPGSKCFFIVRADGSEEGISLTKCIEAAFSTPPSQPSEQSGQSGQKRSREDQSSTIEENPAKKPRREFQPGLVLDVQGIPATMKYEDLKQLLYKYGKVRFVGLEKDKEESLDEADDDENSDGVEGKEGAAAAEVAEGQSGDAEGKTSKQAVMSAHVRFDDAEGPKKALADLKEIEGTQVTVRILDGEDEIAFWEKTYSAFDGKGKAKGKGGKGKGKKGKGGKGKGGKGGKGNRY
eukprot:TRINITY_DN76072_c0_g1_i1.p1 TRINITY_DN76072_c0_g1~~TRINITY_DN76072_c0_g1_i1.p1  ORF type:complete len:398 (-),score=108.47 TRINITY_DN76072_c0_g1_i1:116-1309(-)